MHKHKHMYDLCKTHMHSYVLAEINDGSQVDGIITGLDDEYVYIAVPIDSTDPSAQTMPQGMMPQGMSQGMPQQGMPQQGIPQGMPQQGMPQQGIPQGMPQQGMPQQGIPQGMPQQGMSQGMRNDDTRYGFGYGYGYPGYGYPGYGYPGFYGPRRRFRRLVLPLAALTALSVLPWY
ncbi:hypothetical protein ACFSTA_00100 [Ornithinibacillus salinisoli]|uniref:Spore coat protein n=1 Tax=Ornithinibacillus salinisoli TaxID=1848459 RepID=A0ABW4VWN5_9BACI